MFCVCCVAQLKAPQRKNQAAPCLRIGVELGKSAKDVAKAKADKDKAERKALRVAKKESKAEQKQAAAAKTKAEREVMVKLMGKHGRPNRTLLVCSSLLFV